LFRFWQVATISREIKLSRGCPRSLAFGDRGTQSIGTAIAHPLGQSPASLAGSAHRWASQKGLGGLGVYGGVGRLIPVMQHGAGDKNLVVAAIRNLHSRPGNNLDFRGDWPYWHLRYHQSLFHRWKPDRGYFHR